MGGERGDGSVGGQLERSSWGSEGGVGGRGSDRDAWGPVQTQTINTKRRLITDLMWSFFRKCSHLRPRGEHSILVPCREKMQSNVAIESDWLGV